MDYLDSRFILYPRLTLGCSNADVSRRLHLHMHLADAFIQTQSDLQSAFRLYIFFVSMCVPWELNPQHFALLTQCSTTEPQQHVVNVVNHSMLHINGILVLCVLLTIIQVNTIKICMALPPTQIHAFVTICHFPNQMLFIQCSVSITVIWGMQLVVCC